jgi:uncharacterized membrane protein
MTQQKIEGSAPVVLLTPSAGSAYRFGWRKMKQLFLDLFLITTVVGVVLSPVGMIQGLDGRETAGGVLLNIFMLAYIVLLFAPIDYGSAFVFLKAVRNEPFEVKDLFLPFENYLNVVLGRLLTHAIIGMGIMLLIVPGIIFACRLAFVKYLIMDRKMDPVPAVKESWRMTRGYAGKIFLLGLLAIPLAIAGLICLVVGIVPVIIWVRCAFASMFFAVSELEKTTNQER